jgi:hypothetical protein
MHADRRTVTLSMPVKIVALAGLALTLGAAGLLMVAGRHHAAAQPLPLAPVHAAPVHTPKPAPRPHPAPVRIDPNVPAIVASSLRRHPVVVVVVYDSRLAGDRTVYREARAGAHAAHAGFLAANVAKNKVAAGVATWGTVAVPAVVVTKRPGPITFAVPGATDRDTVAQAAVAAR